MRLILSLVLACLCAGGASANPIAFVLENAESAPEVSDPAASNAHESAGEPSAAGELDTADLSRLGGRLTTIALAYEAFRDPSHLDAEAKGLVDYTSPQGLIPDPSDRARTLDRVYRALAVLDDTQALRYPQGDACARAHRLALLRSPDGLFADPKTGELSPWLRAELKRSTANEAPGGLITASAREWTALGYLKSLAEVRTVSLSLADQKLLGAPRAAAYCRRAKLYEELSSAQSSFAWSDPDLSAQSKSVVEVRWGKDKGSGTALLVGGKAVVLVSGRFTGNVYEAPELYAKSGRRLYASYARRGPTLSLLSIQPSTDIEPLSLPEEPEQEERVSYAVGHPIQGGPWSVTRGLARSEGAVIRTDAAVDGTQAGGPLFDAHGRLTGIVAGQWTAYGLAEIRNWLADENEKLPELPVVAELGSGALLTASSKILEEKSGLIESSNIVCKDVRGCTLPSASSGGGSNYSNYSYSGPYNGPTFWDILNLFKRAPKKEQKIPDNRRQATPYATPTAPHAPAVPPPPPDPLKPVALKLSVSRTTLAQGEDLEAIATITFTGKEGNIAGRGVSFTVVPGGKISCPAGSTDASGVARTTCTAIESGHDRAFDALEDETRRRRGMRTPGRIRRKPAKGDKNAEQKERLENAIDELDAQADKYPELRTDPSDIDKATPEAEIAELVIKGDRVTLGASLERLNDVMYVDVLERPCTEGSPIPNSGLTGAKEYRCPGTLGAMRDKSKKQIKCPKQERHEGVIIQTNDGPKTVFFTECTWFCPYSGTTGPTLLGPSENSYPACPDKYDEVPD